jgi:hypothetical protein
MKRLDALLDCRLPIDWSHPLNRGLIGEWTAPPLAGWQGGLKLRDLVRSGKVAHEGTLTNGPLWQGARGRSGGYGSLSLTAANNQYVTLGATGLGGGSVGTVTAWLNLPANPSGQGVFCVGAAASNSLINMYVNDVFGNGSNRLAISDFTNDVSTDTSVILTTNRWHHVAITSNGSAWTAYINGISVPLTFVTGGSNVGTWFGAIASPTTVFGASYRFGSVGGYLGGSLDGIQVFNRCLSASEMASLYAETRLGNPERWRWLRTRYYSLPVSGLLPVQHAAVAGGQLYTAGGRCFMF